jgi:two-component system response regulator BaeR
MLPRLDGIEVLRRAREHTAHPIIMLTARIEEVDRLLGLELGADDYVCKPFSPRELVARVRAVLRRTAGRPGADRARPGAQGDAPGLVLDDVHWRASLEGTPLNLTRREFGLLQVLSRHPGRIFSRARLLELAYDDTVDVTERAIDSHVKNLRRKLGAVTPRTTGYGRCTAWALAVFAQAWEAPIPSPRERGRRVRAARREPDEVAGPQALRLAPCIAHAEAARDRHEQHVAIVHVGVGGVAVAGVGDHRRLVRQPFDEQRLAGQRVPGVHVHGRSLSHSNPRMSQPGARVCARSTESEGPLLQEESMTTQPLRRALLGLAVAGALYGPTASWSAADQAYPVKPITIIVPFPAGGGTDVIFRSVQVRLQAALGCRSSSTTAPARAAPWARASARRPTPTATRWWPAPRPPSPRPMRCTPSCPTTPPRTWCRSAPSAPRPSCW